MIRVALILAALLFATVARAQNGPAPTVNGMPTAGDLVIWGSDPAKNTLADGGAPSAASKLVEVTVTGVSANTALAPALPANCTLFLVTADETSNNAVTGGIILGTTSGGAQVFTGPGTLGASGTLVVNAGAFNPGEQQIGGSTLYIGSSNWGSGVVNAQAYCLEQ